MPNNGGAGSKPFQRQPYKRSIQVNGRKGRLLKLGAFWSRTDKKGRVYLSGKLGQGNALLFENSYKEKDNHPDYFLYLAVEPLEEELQDSLDVAPSPKAVKPLTRKGAQTDADGPVAPRYLIVEDVIDDGDAFEDDDDEWEL